MEKKVLIIVDFQKDFYDKENGSLYVPGAENCVLPICEKIRNEEFCKVVLTLDWHGFCDESFAEHGGLWPVHCVQYTEGASIHPEIMKALKETGMPYEVFLKGTVKNHEEYGAFEKAASVEGGLLRLMNFAEDSCVVLNPKEECEICGLAGSHCVWESYKNLKKHGFCVTPFYEGMAFIGESFTY